MGFDLIDFRIDQGADWNIQMVLKNDDGTLLNLTGCQVHMQVRAFPQSPVVLIDLSTANGSMTLNGQTAQLNWFVPGATTLNYQPKPGLLIPNPLSPLIVAQFGSHDIFIEWPGGQLTKYAAGQIFLSLDVTRPF